MKILNKKYGFSLLETLLYIAILSIIIVSIGTFYSMIIREKTKNFVIAEVEQQGQFIVDNITQSIRNASSVVSPTPQVNSNSLTLSMLNPVLNQTIISQSGKNIMIQEGVTPAIALNGSRVEVASLSFINMTKVGSPGSVKISIILKYKNPGARQEFEYQKTFNTSASIRQ